MIPKPKRKDLIIHYILSNPISAREILFSNLRNLTEFERNKFSCVRKYQYPMAAFDTLFLYDKTKSEKENFELKRGMAESYNLGGRLTGKCEEENNYCQLANGKRIKFKNLINTNQKILCLDEETGKIKITEAIFENNGIKNCIEINLEGGKQIIITTNHPLLTDKGWVISKNLKKGDWIATPKKLDVKSTKKINKQIAAMLGYLIGDGSCNHSGIGFTNINPEIIKEIYQLSKYFKCRITNKNDDYKFTKLDIYERDAKGFPKKNNIQKLVLKYKINTLSKNKQLPEEIFTWHKKYIAILLNRLFACDGYIEKRNLGITLASKELIYQIHSLLLRFGIYSVIYYQRKKCNNKLFDAWTILITEDYNKFMNLIGIKGKDLKYGIKIKKVFMGDHIPSSLFFNIISHLKGIGIIKKLELRKLRQYNFSRQKWIKLNNKIKNNNIKKIIQSDIHWNKIKTIKFVGKKNTVMVSVPKYHTYISNDIISHNSHIGIKTDVPPAVMRKTFIKGVIDSFDKVHLKGVIDDLIDIFNLHPILSSFKINITQTPDYDFNFIGGINLKSVNNKPEGKNKGDQWLQKHIDRDWAEEASELTEEVTKKKFMAKSELGMIQRLTGMTEFNDLSPMGKIFNNLGNKNKIINIPSYANPTYSEKDDEEAIQEFNGKDSAGYQTQILGRIIPNVANPIDIEKVRKCYNENLLLKQFEINKDNFFRYKEIIILDRPNNAEKAGIYLDVGEGAAPTEIIIIFKIKNKFKYHYNITVNKITPDELYELARYIISLITPNVIGYDNTSGVGKALGSNLSKDFASNLIAVDFNAKIPVDYEKDENGNYKTDNNGNYIYKYERVDDWSFQQFKRIFYNKMIEMPYDYKFDKQVQNLIVKKQGAGVRYECKVANHLWQAFQVFCITEWHTEFVNIKPAEKEKPSLGYFGGI